MKVLVNDDRGWSWTGEQLWTEKGYGSMVWCVIRPDEWSVHARRGSGNSEYNQNLIRVLSENVENVK